METSPAIDHEQIAKALLSSEPIAAPEDFIEWLTKIRSVQPLTAKLYKPIVSRFFQCMALLQPAVKPSLDMAYDPKLVIAFFSVMSHIISESTLSNYHSGMQGFRKYLRFTGL